jgi:hypothetical protein
MFNRMLPTATESCDVSRGRSLAKCGAIICVVIAVAGAADVIFHEIWLPSLVSHLAVQQFRPDDTVAAAMRSLAYWANWSHALLAALVGVVACALFVRHKDRVHHAAWNKSAGKEEA